MIREVTTSTHLMFKCWNILQHGALEKPNKGGRVGTHFRNGPENRAVKMGIRNKMPIQMGTSIFDLNK